MENLKHVRVMRFKGEQSIRFATNIRSYSEIEYSMVDTQCDRDRK